MLWLNIENNIFLMPTLLPFQPFSQVQKSSRFACSSSKQIGNFFGPGRMVGSVGGPASKKHLILYSVIAFPTGFRNYSCDWANSPSPVLCKVVERNLAMSRRAEQWSHFTNLFCTNHSKSSCKDFLPTRSHQNFFCSVNKRAQFFQHQQQTSRGFIR